MHQYPLVKIDLLLGEQKVNLIEDRIDLAIRITNDLEPGLIAKKLALCQTSICASPQYLEKYGTPRHPVELSSHNCLTHSFSTKLEWQFRDNDELINVPVCGSLSTNEAVVLMDASLKGFGIAKLPTFLARNHIQKGALVHLMPSYKSHEMGIYCVYTSRQLMSKALRTLIDHLSSHFHETVVPGN